MLISKILSWKLIKHSKGNEKLPHDDLLNNLQCLDPSKQGKEVMRSKFMTLAKQFPDVVSKEDQGKLDSELRNYDTYEMPDVIDRTDVVKYWIDVGNLNDTAQDIPASLFTC